MLALALGLALAAACGSESPAGPTASATSPRASATPEVVVVISAAAPSPTATPRPPATATTTPGVVLGVETATPPPSVTPSPSPSPTPPCTNNMVFISDVTVPDGTQFLPGQGIDKRWGVRNAGTCDWQAGYRLVLVSGNALGPRTELALYPAKAGTEATLQVPMLAPAEPGQYTGRWQARDPEGNLFGNVVFIKIEVVPLPEAPPPEAPPEQPPPAGN